MNTAKFIRLHMVYDCFCTTTAEYLQQRCIAYEIFLSDPLQKKFTNLWCSGLVKAIYIIACIQELIFINQKKHETIFFQLFYALLGKEQYFANISSG